MRALRSVNRARFRNNLSEEDAAESDPEQYTSPTRPSPAEEFATRKRGAEVRRKEECAPYVAGRGGDNRNNWNVDSY